jgi:arylsulfatase A-like enzyme
VTEKDPKSKKPKPKAPKAQRPGRRMPVGNIGPATRWTPGEARPDIMVIVLDDLVEADMNASRTPHWIAFRNQSRRFTNAYSHPKCSQSRASMEFGLHNRHITTNIGITLSEYNPFTGPEPLAAQATLTQLIQAAGYLPELIGKWHLGRNPVTGAANPLGAPQVRGYSHWRAGAPENLITGYTNWARVDDLVGTTEPDYATIAQVEEAAGRWASMAKPKFMMYAGAAPHAPSHVPPASILEGYVSDGLPGSGAQTSDRQNYERQIRSADWAIGQLLSLQGMNDALVIILADNGRPVFGGLSVGGVLEDTTRLKGTAYDLGCRVPLAIRGPTTLVQPGSDARLVHIVDLPVTLLARVGIAKPSGWDGFDMLASQTANVRTSALMESFDNATNEEEQGAVGYGAGNVAAGYKLVRHTTAHPADPTFDELYNLATDPTETATHNGPHGPTQPGLNLTTNATIANALRAVIDGP